jgi:hypothetical protein
VGLRYSLASSYRAEGEAGLQADGQGGKKQASLKLFLSESNRLYRSTSNTLLNNRIITLRISLGKLFYYVINKQAERLIFKRL